MGTCALQFLICADVHSTAQKIQLNSFYLLRFVLFTIKKQHVQHTVAVAVATDAVTLQTRHATGWCLFTQMSPWKSLE